MKNRFETRIHIKKRAPKITTRFITSMTTTFYVTWTAYILTSILTMAGITLSYSVTIISSLLTKSGAVVYPLIYIFFFDEVRDDINKLSYEYCSLICKICPVFVRGIITFFSFRSGTKVHIACGKETEQVIDSNIQASISEHHRTKQNVVPVLDLVRFLRDQRCLDARLFSKKLNYTRWKNPRKPYLRYWVIIS